MPRKSRSKRLVERRNKISRKSLPGMSRYRWVFAIGTASVVLLLFFFWKWANSAFDFISIATYKSDGRGEIVLINKKENSFIVLTVPENTLMSVSSQRGNWQMKSLWPLIEGESLEGEMLSNTFMKTFHLPIFDWIGGNGDSSLSTREKIQLELFKKFKPVTQSIDLLETTYLTSTKLSDGDEGYIVSDDIPNSIKQYFVDSSLVNQNLNINIINSSSFSRAHLGDFVLVLENMGVHTVSIRNSDQNVSGCEMKISESNVVLESISNYFDCNISGASETTIDGEIIVGDDFINWF